MPATFLTLPGRPGAMGALMDEYARAAGDLCRLVEQLPASRFTAETTSRDPDTTSIRSICGHAVAAANGYATYIRKARNLPLEDRTAQAASVNDPADLRPCLVAALHYTEGALDGLYEASEEAIAAIRFEVRWGPTYDPDMLLEHAIVHLLRHRRQIERWP